MAKKPPTLYSTKKTMMWFAIVSIILLMSLVTMVLLDHSRDWKQWQREFTKLKREKVEQELEKASKKVSQKKLAQLTEQHEQAEQELKEHRKEYKKTQSQSSALDGKIVKLKAEVQNLQQFRDSYKYFYEELHHKGDAKAEEYLTKINELNPQIKEKQLQLERLETEKEAIDEQISSFTSKEKEIEKKKEAMLREKNRLEKAVKNLKPSLVKAILNAPMLDFIAPTLRVQQIVLENLEDDYHYAKVQKVDRCTTCHLAIDQKGFEDAPQPFTTHPNLELFLSTESSHPIEKMGCTTCHGGNGHSVDFTYAAHTPSTREQADQWSKKYGWSRLEKWENKMLPTKHLEASCAKCHTGQFKIEEAPALNEGRELARVYGCFGCHNVQGFEEYWKAGPDLTHLRSKVSNEWITKWLQDPKAFRESTKMPQIFHLSNMTSKEDHDKDNASIIGVTKYLMDNSSAIRLISPEVSGNAQRGKKNLETFGCLGCHSQGDNRANNYGPELSELGSKVSADWLYTWLKDPKHYSPNTRMPSLRLSDQEAADITAYLLQDKNPKFDEQPLPQPNFKTVDELLSLKMQSKMTHAQIQKELSDMSNDDKLLELGKQTIANQGCYACHDIKGFEDAKPIGTDLSDHARKNIHQLYFGNVHIDHTRHDWFKKKLLDPRAFDDGKMLGYYEKARMPQFNFTDDQASKLTTFLLSLTKESVPLEMQNQLTTQGIAVSKGRYLVAKFNCQGCHTLDGKTGGILELYEDAGSGPPNLQSEGAKVQEAWLRHFLSEPSIIRPWLEIRMPSFEFSEKQLDTLIYYFDGLDNETPSYHGYAAPESSSDKIAAGKELFSKLQCMKCHQPNQIPGSGLTASFLAPNLGITKERLKPDWVVEWLADPQRLQEGTKMPGFFPDGATPLPDILDGDAQAQMEAVRDFLYRYDPQQKN